MAEIALTKDWQKISTGRPLFIQNTGLYPLRVIYSVEYPTQNSSFIVYPKTIENFLSVGLPIWVSASSIHTTTAVYEYSSTPSDFRTEIGLGRKSDHESTGANGQRTSLVNGSLCDLWSGTNDIRSELDVAEIINISSSSSEDVVGGLGAEYVLVRGLDSSYEQQEEVVILTGLVAASTSLPFLRLNQLVAGGSNPEANTGDISFVSSVSGLEIDFIPANEGTSATAALTVPAHHTGILAAVTGGVERNDDAKLIVKARVPSLNGGAYATVIKQAMSPQAYGLTYKEFGFPEKTDFKLQILANSPTSFAVGTIAVLFIPTI